MKFTEAIKMIERESLHVMDNKQRIAMVETKTRDNNSSDKTTFNLAYIRYQYSNHLDSACLELNEKLETISYEEYHPYGTTSYNATDKSTNPIAKRYRYTGLERDEETGFGYHSARYFIPWFGRWASCDPVGLGDGLNIYAYVRNNPCSFFDIYGKERKKPQKIDVDLREYSTAGTLQVEGPLPPGLRAKSQVSSLHFSQFPKKSYTTTNDERAALLKPIKPLPLSPLDKYGDLKSELSLYRKNIDAEAKEIVEIQGRIENEIIPKNKLNTEENNPTNDVHLANVTKVINWALKGAEGETLGERWENARLSVTELRQNSDKNSESLILRDAQYYLWGLTLITKVESKTKVPDVFVEPYLAILAHDIYSAQKWIELNFNISLYGKVTDRPYSAIGGGNWYDIGIKEFYKERDYLKKDVAPLIYDTGQFKQSIKRAEESSAEVRRSISIMAQ
jgi:RHS repeat-associated protein